MFLIFNSSFKSEWKTMGVLLAAYLVGTDLPYTCCQLDWHKVDGNLMLYVGIFTCWPVCRGSRAQS